MAAAGLCKVENAIGNASGIHQVSRKNKEWDGQQGKAGGAGIGALGHDSQKLPLTQGRKYAHRGEPHADSHGNPNHHETNQQHTHN